LLSVSLANLFPTSVGIVLKGTSLPAILLKFVILEGNLAHARQISCIPSVERTTQRIKNLSDNK